MPHFQECRTLVLADLPGPSIYFTLINRTLISKHIAEALYLPGYEADKITRAVYIADLPLGRDGANFTVVEPLLTSTVITPCLNQNPSESYAFRLSQLPFPDVVDLKPHLPYFITGHTPITLNDILTLQEGLPVNLRNSLKITSPIFPAAMTTLTVSRIQIVTYQSET